MCKLKITHHIACGHLVHKPTPCLECSHQGGFPWWKWCRPEVVLSPGSCPLCTAVTWRSGFPATLRGYKFSAESRAEHKWLCGDYRHVVRVEEAKIRLQEGQRWEVGSFIRDSMVRLNTLMRLYLDAPPTPLPTSNSMLTYTSDLQAEACCRTIRALNVIYQFEMSKKKLAKVKSIWADRSRALEIPLLMEIVLFFPTHWEIEPIMQEYQSVRYLPSEEIEAFPKGEKCAICWGEFEEKKYTCSTLTVQAYILCSMYHRMC
jgi:hypothetical protein